MWDTVSGFLARPPGEWGAQTCNLGRDNASTKLNGMDSLLDFKPTRQVNKIIHGHAPNKQREEQNKPARNGGNKGRTSEDKVDGRELPRELLDNGQGKSFLSDMDISTSSEENAPPLATTDTTMPLGCASSNIINLLSPPIIVARATLQRVQQQTNYVSKIDNTEMRHLYNNRLCLSGAYTGVIRYWLRTIG